MSKLYNFIRLIDKYSVKFTLVTLSEGEYISGKYVDAVESTESLTGAIVPMPDSKIYQSGGVLTQKDRQLYMKTPITKALTNAKVQYKGNEYTIEQGTDYADYADAYVYSLKWVKQLSD